MAQTSTSDSATTNVSPWKYSVMYIKFYTYYLKVNATTDIGTGQGDEAMDWENSSHPYDHQGVADQELL